MRVQPAATAWLAAAVPAAAPAPATGMPAAAAESAQAGAESRRAAGNRLRLALLAGPAGLLLADLLALVAAAVTAFAVTGPADAPAAVAGFGVAGYAAAVLAVLAGGGQFRLRITPRVADQAGRLVTAAGVPALGLLPWLPAATVLTLALLTAGLLVIGRGSAYAVIRAARRRGLVAEPALVVGAGETGQALAAAARKYPGLGLRPAGFLDTGRGDCPGPGGLPVPVLGRPADLAAVVRRHGIRRVLVAFPAEPDRDLVTALRAARELPADVCLVPRLHEAGTGLPRAVLDEAWGFPLIPLRRRGRAGLAAKRAFDVSAALVLLGLASPLLLVLGAAVRVRLRRPALFRQTRVTGRGRLAEIVKLRTVTVTGDPDSCWVVPPQQATALGRFLRASHLDELPQLVNVIRGEMSLVGPRPERPYFASRFEREVPGYAGRHRVTAGLTGWAQVHGLNGDTSIAERARFDNAYIEDRSFWLDLVILGRTVAGSLAALLTNRDDGLSRAGRAAAPPTPDPVPSPDPAWSGPIRTTPPAGGNQ